MTITNSSIRHSSPIELQQNRTPFNTRTSSVDIKSTKLIQQVSHHPSPLDHQPPHMKTASKDLSRPILKRSETATKLGITEDELDSITRSLNPVQKLGNGSFGSVYRINDNTVLKIEIPSNYDEGIIRAALDSRVSGKDNNQIIALSRRTYQLRIITKMPYKGEQTIKDNKMNTDLKHFVEDERGRLRICKKLVDQLTPLHNKNIAHRDIKPENILFQINEARTDYQLNLIDALPSGRLTKEIYMPLMIETRNHIFDALRGDSYLQNLEKKGSNGRQVIANALVKAASDWVGTVRYMSPETAYAISSEESTLAANGPILESDVFSLGITLLELISGCDKLHYNEGAPAELGLYDRKYITLLTEARDTEVIVNDQRPEGAGDAIIIDFRQGDKNSEGKDKTMIVSIPETLNLSDEFVQLFQDMLTIETDQRATLESVREKLDQMLAEHE